MTRLITYLAFLLTLQLACNGQNNVNLTDSVIEVGQIKSFQIVYRLSGNCYPTNESNPILDSIFEFLNNNESLIIEIGANTDYRGDSIFNQILSEKRAKQIYLYLIAKGIDPNRLSYKGYGEYNSVTVDSVINKQYSFLVVGQKLNYEYIKKLDTKEKQEIAHMLNRRTVIKIIGIKNRP